MKDSPMRRGAPRILIVALLCALAATATAAPAPATPATPAPQREWRSLRTANFHIVGNAGERSLRQVAERLEQFREAFATIFPRAISTAPRLVTVIVFRNHKAFEPFKPVHQGRILSHIAGYYQGGLAADYVALTTEGGFDYGTIYHEYVHVLTKGVGAPLPVWFEEGLAEYYETFEIAGRRHAALGRVEESHVFRLREQWLPLQALLTIDRNSPHYNEGDKAGIFYAESWALVHYLLLADQQKYMKRVVPFLQKLAAGTPPQDACAEALQVPLATLERDLRRYVEQNIFPSQAVTFTERLASLERVPVAPFAEADAHATLGDLLLQMRRQDEAHGQLAAALALEPEHAPAHASMGRLLFMTERRQEARAHLERAVASPGADWLTHYTYAFVLDEARRSGAGADLDDRIERALRRTIELNPSHAESYAQLAWLKMGKAGQEAEVDALVRQAVERAPGEPRFLYLYATVLIERGHEAEGKLVLSRLTTSSDEWIRRTAIDRLAYLGTRRPAQPPGTPDTSTPAGAAGSDAMTMPIQRDLAAGEERTGGILSAIECAGSTIALSVKVEGKPVRLRVRRFEEVEFITYRSELEGQVTCGPRRTPEPVIVTYRPSPQEPGMRGDVVAVEFMPDGFDVSQVR